MFYTYKIIWTQHKKWYFGVRYAEKSSTEDLFKTYFTSSKNVKGFIEENGLPDIIKITKIFKDKESAISWENRFLVKTHAHLNPDSLNLTTNKAIHPYHASKHSKGKTYEDIYGMEKALILKNKRSESNRNRKTKPWNDDARKSFGLKQKGGNNSRALSVMLMDGEETINFNSVKECSDFISNKYAIEDHKALHQCSTRILRVGNGTFSDKTAFHSKLKHLFLKYI